MKLSVAGCYIQNSKGELLLLKRLPQKSQGDLWGFPGGKIDSDETPKVAAQREVYEETGLELNENDLKFLKLFNFDFGEKQVDFHLFSAMLPETSEIKINPGEHSAYKWLSLEEAIKQPDLMHGLPEIWEYLKQLHK